jgi:hypothetical protein
MCFDNLLLHFTIQCYHKHYSLNSKQYFTAIKRRVINAEITLIKTKKNVGVNFYLQCSSGHVSLEKVPLVQNKGQ